MRKQTKLAVVLAAAALLAVGSASLVSATGWVQEGAEWRYVDNEGDYVTETMKKSGDVTFYLDENGYMAKDYFLQDYSNNNGTYYFGANGAMVRNTWVAIDPALVDGSDEDQDVCWFYFQDTGKAYKASSQNGTSKKKIDGKTYFFNNDGIMFTGWFDKEGTKYNPDENNDFINNNGATKMYYAGEDGVARSGWLAYSGGLVDEQWAFDNSNNDDLSDRSTLYFYFNTSNFEMIVNKDKTINGKKYRFDNNGVMVSGWEYLNAKYNSTGWATASYAKYYSGSDDGHQVKKGWVYAVPSTFLDNTKHEDDEEAYFYFDNSGNMYKGIQKKINSKWYAFNAKGLMKTGLIFIGDGSKYLDKMDLDYCDGAEWIKEGIAHNDEPTSSNQHIIPFNTVNYDENWTDTVWPNDTKKYRVTLHYFGSDGAKVTGSKIPVEFTDDTYYFASKNSGGFTGKEKKKFYSNGFLLKAKDDIKYGLVIATEGYARKEYDAMLINSGCTPSEIGQSHSNGIDADELRSYLRVVTTTGAVKKGGKYKDADGNYWLVGSDESLWGIYNCEVKYDRQGMKYCSWKSDIKDGWVDYVNSTNNWWSTSHKLKDSTSMVDDDIKDHLVSINNDYCLNFTVK